MRKLAILAAASLVAVSTAANAQYLFDSNGDTTGTINFTGTEAGTSGSLVLTLDTFDAATGVFNFSYTLTNMSNLVTNPGSRITAFGFNDGGGTATGTTSGSDTNRLTDVVFDQNISGGSNFVDVCVTTNNCSGGGFGGAIVGDPSTGFFTLDYTGSLSSLTASNFIIRFQSTGANLNGSGIGTPNTPPPPPPPPVPEPATWAMMLIGFGATGIAMRRRRKSALLTQIA